MSVDFILSLLIFQSIFENIEIEKKIMTVTVFGSKACFNKIHLSVE